MHNDLCIGHKVVQEETKKRIEKNFKETEAEKFSRLTKEYDLIVDHEHSEWYILYLRQLTDIKTLFDPNVKREEDKDPQKWFNYAQFCLKYGMKEKADLLMQKYILIKGLDLKLNIVMGAMNL